MKRGAPVAVLRVVPLVCGLAGGLLWASEPGGWLRWAGGRDPGGGHLAVRELSLEMELSLEPVPVRIGVDHRIRVRVAVWNRGVRLCGLEFPTEQRFELRLVEGARGVVETWSEDRRFGRVPAWVALNPGERLEYQAELSARDLEPGGSYAVEGWLAGYPAVRARMPLSAVE